MIAGPVLKIDLEKLKGNALRMTEICSRYGISVTGVTKVSCGMPQAARVLLEGGVESIGESRMENIHRLRASGMTAPVMLLRIPPLSAVEEIVTTVDISINSELSVMEALSGAAAARGIIHRVMLMLDLGDLREGIWPDDLMPLVNRAMELPGIKIVGLGTNLTCYGGVLPSADNMNTLVRYAEKLESKFSLELELVSGGNSSSIPLLLKGKMPSRINNLRIGEALMLGRETAYGEFLDGFSRSVFSLSAELIEIKEKPSVPIGERGKDAFGESPLFDDRGKILRGILNIGREDVAVDGLAPEDPDVSILGASSDHLLVDISRMVPRPGVGDRISFGCNYAALLASMTSSYVTKDPFLPDGEKLPPRQISVHGKISVRGRKWFQDSVRRLNLQVVKNGDFDIARSIPVLTGKKPLLEKFINKADSASLPLGLILIDSVPSLNRLSDGFAAWNLSPENIVLIGVRKAEKAEAETIRRMNIRTYTMEDVDMLGIHEVTVRGIRRASSGTRGIILRFSGKAGGPGGLTGREFHFMLEILAGSETVRCIDVSGSSLDSFTCRLLETALGKKILGEG